MPHKLDSIMVRAWFRVWARVNSEPLNLKYDQRFRVHYLGFGPKYEVDGFWFDITLNRKP